MKRYCPYLLPLLIAVVAGSCKKFVNVNAPIYELSSSSVFASNATAIAVMTNVYSSSLNTDVFYYEPSLMADELSLYDVTMMNVTALFWNNYTSGTSAISGVWGSAYTNIFTVNNVLANLQNAPNLSPAVIQQLQGEALFIRGLSYFYLVNFYGGVPLVLTTDYKTNAVLGRSSEEVIWDQVESDLRASRDLLSKNFLDATLMAPTTARVRPSYWSADALLARTLLYRQKWSGADSAASELINNQAQFGLVSLDSIVLKDNQEAIWQLQITSTYPWTNQGAFFKLPPGGPNTSGNYPAYLGENLYESFEAGDQRKTHWIDSVTVSGITYRFPYKYKIGTLDVSAAPNECSTLFRLAEQYLIRAEARTEMNELALAQADLNVIRQRAGLGNTTATSQTDIFAAIQRERRIELFTEGHRWFDLKRTGAIDSVMTVSCQQKGGPGWASFEALWPLPSGELSIDPGLKGQQNPGYN